VCTISVVPTADGFRLACNRDERRTRPTASGPRLHRTGAHQALWPVDPQSGGTWIGVNDAGLAMVLLNRHPRNAPASTPTESRGVLIPRLLGAARIETVVARARTELRSAGAHVPFEPFTLVMIQRHDVATVDYRAGTMAIMRRRLTRPVMFTSSSLGDELVDPPRRRLFAALVESSRRPLAAQAQFHRHSWPDRPQISVRMTRTDAATVSHTTIDVCGETIAIEYLCSSRSSSARSSRRI
jgi:hypothetical protein